MTQVRPGRTTVTGRRPSSIKVSEDGTFKATQPEINFIGATVVDNPDNNRVDVTVQSSFPAQNANLVYAGPATGAAAAPTFRALVAADLPSDSGAYWKTAGASTLTLNTDISGAVDLSIGVNAFQVTTNGGLSFLETSGDIDILNIAGAVNITGTTGVNINTPSILVNSNTVFDVVASAGSDILNIGTGNADVINIGYSGSTINITGTLAYQNVTNLQVTDKLFTVNKGGGIASGVSAGFEIEENAIITGYFATNGTRDGWDFKAPAITGVATFSLASLTGNQTYTLPDASGTIALTSNIIGPANGGTGVANNAASTLTISGNFATTFTVTGTTGVTLPTTGTLATVAGTWATGGTSTLTATTTIDGAQTLIFDNDITDFTGTDVRFDNTVFKIWNAARTFTYNFVGGPLAANRSVTLPTFVTSSNLLGCATAELSSTRIPIMTGVTGIVTSSANLTFSTNRLSGTTLYVTVSGGTTAAGTAPFKMTSGTNLTTPENGAFEYNGTNLFFTRTGAVRENIVCASAVNVVSPTAPNRTITINIDGTTYYLHAKTTND